MVLTDEKSRPVSTIIASASVHEVKLEEQLIAERASRRRPGEAFPQTGLMMLTNWIEGSGAKELS